MRATAAAASATEAGDPQTSRPEGGRGGEAVSSLQSLAVDRHRSSLQDRGPCGYGHCSSSRPA